MPKVQVTSQIDLNEVLSGIAQLDTPELEQFVNQALALQAQHRAPSLPQEEAELLKKINQSLPPDVQHRYDELTAKRRAETLTDEEHQELIGLIERIELTDAEQMQHMIELAQLRGVTIEALMDELGIHSPAYA